MRQLLFFLMTLPLCSLARDYQSEGQKFTVEKLFEGKEVIWGFDFLNSDNCDEILFTERSGKIRYLNLKTKMTTEVFGAPKVFHEGQGGLLDLYIDHKDSDIYLTYSEPVGEEATTSLFKGKLSTNKTKIIGRRIFQAKAFSKNGEHFGSRIVIDKEGFVFMSVGERFERDKAQDLSVHHGKILRLTKDGKAAADNPFIKTSKALPEIWSLGHRNPQGLFIDRTGALIEAEFGPRGGDEVNLIEKGRNYGWPVVTYGSEYWGPKIGVTQKAGMASPLQYWVPSISPSGLMIYSGKSFPKFDGNVFLATLGGTHIHRVVIDKNFKLIREEKLLEDLDERFRQIKAGGDGLIYVTTDSGKILRLKPL